MKKRYAKPVRRCRGCLLNCGDHCWLYRMPRREWCDRICHGFGNMEVYTRFNEWRNGPHVKTGKDLRRERSPKYRADNPGTFGKCRGRNRLRRRLGPNRNSRS